MSFLCWNSRGMGNPWSVRRLRRWSNVVAPDMISLSETKISEEKVKGLKSRFGFTNAFGDSSRGRSGGYCNTPTIILFLK